MSFLGLLKSLLDLALLAFAVGGTSAAASAPSRLPCSRTGLAPHSAS
jgi:hypothetical protein